MPDVEQEVGTAQVVHDDATQEPLLNLAPRRANWDLKRDLEPQMKKLRGATDRAVVKLIAKRVAEEEGGEAGQGEGLATAIDAQQRQDAEDDD